MKLSEAIRLGAMLKPQAFGDYFRDGGSCAVGAACEALSIRDVLSQIAFREQQWERTMPGLFTCPACSMEHPAIKVVTHLNDYHRWTREQIADWVATIESADAPDAQPEQIEAVSA